MKYSVKYYLESRKKKSEDSQRAPIIVSITYSSKRLFYYTGKSCNPKDWDSVKARMKKGTLTTSGENSRDCNSELDRIKVVIDELFKKFNYDKILPGVELLRAELKSSLDPLFVESSPKSFFEYYREYIDGLDLSEGRIKKHNTTFNKVKRYNALTTFESITSDYLISFQKWLTKAGGTAPLNSDSSRAPIPLAKNTVISELKRFKAFLNWANTSGFLKKMPKNFKIEAESYGDPVFITLDERDLLFSAVLTSEKLARTRDMFVLQSLLGCRVGDLVQLKHKNIVNGCIEYIAAKTRKNSVRIARVPISAKAIEIIAKYNLPNGDLMPYITGQKFNQNLKELFAVCGLNRMVTVSDPKTRKSKTVPICEIASSHMARRVFVGSLYRNGVKNEIIGSMSGHVAGSRAFSRYHNIDLDQQAAAIKLIE